MEDPHARRHPLPRECRPSNIHQFYKQQFRATLPVHARVLRARWWHALSRAGRMHTCLGHNTHGPSVLHSTAADVDAGTPQRRCGTTPPSPHKLNLGQEDATGPSVQNLPECLPARVAKEVSYIYWGSLHGPQEATGVSRVGRAPTDIFWGPAVPSSAERTDHQGLFVCVWGGGSGI